MAVYEIPQPHWPDFLGQFGFRHFGWNAVVEQKKNGHATPALPNHCFLEELTTDGSNGHQQITIVIGSPFHGFRKYVVSDACRVSVAERQNALRIDSADGSATIVHVRQPGRAA